MTDTFDISEFKKQFETVVKENQKLDLIKNRYAEFSENISVLAEALSDIVQQLNKISGELDPVKSMQTRKYGNKKETIEELYNAMLTKDVHINRKYINTVYPDFSDIDVNYILNNLQKLNKVEKAKDGKAVRLYIRK